MKQKTDCFIACQSLDDVMPAVEQLRRSRVVRHIFLLVNEELAAQTKAPQDCTLLVTKDLTSSAFVALLAEHAVASYVLLCLKPFALQLGESALERMMLVAGDTEAAMLYSDHYTMEQGVRKQHPSRVPCVTISTSVVSGWCVQISYSSMLPQTMSVSISMPVCTTCVCS